MASRGNHWAAATLLLIMLNALISLSLTCLTTDYETTNRTCCPMCPAGARVEADCTENKNTSCVSCLNGTYMDHPTGSKQCFRCSNCKGTGLKVKRFCTVTSDTVCEPMEGFYCIDPKDDNCVAAHAHTKCKSGQYIQGNGTADRDTLCFDCSNGTFSDGTFTSCQTHRQCEAENRQLIKAGTPSDDAQCGAISTGYIALIVGVTILVVLLVICLLVGAIMLYKRKIRYYPAFVGVLP